MGPGSVKLLKAFLLTCTDAHEIIMDVKKGPLDARFPLPTGGFPHSIFKECTYIDPFSSTQKQAGQYAALMGQVRLGAQHRHGAKKELRLTPQVAWAQWIRMYSRTGVE